MRAGLAVVVVFATAVAALGQARPRGPFGPQWDVEIVDRAGNFIGRSLASNDDGNARVTLRSEVDKTVFFNLTVGVTDVYADYEMFFASNNCTGQGYVFIDPGVVRDSLEFFVAFGPPGRMIHVPVRNGRPYTGQVASSFNEYTRRCERFPPFSAQDEEYPAMPVKPIGNWEQWYSQPYRFR